MKTSFFILCLLFIFASCTTNQNTTVQGNNNFYALTEGNSWVYKNYKLDSRTNDYEETSVIDSITVLSSKIIRGNMFYKVRTLTTGNEEHITFCNPNGEHIDFLRDSLGYLINDKGEIKHSYVNYSERLVRENSWGNLYETLQKGIEEINVESGTFGCVLSKRYAKDQDNRLFPANDFFYYADGVGLIYDTSSFVSQDTPTIIRRLDSYKLN